MSAESLPDRVIRRYKSAGLSGLLGSVQRLAVPQRARCMAQVKAMLQGLDALEVGGPSAVFGRRGVLPAYSVLRSVDTSNFSASTVWQGEMDIESEYLPESGGASGKIVVCDSVDMSVIPDASYDVVLSSHVLEHIANPIKALNEWGRVLRPSGVLVMLTPRREATFDHRRPVTALEHLVQDFEQDVSEADLTHLEEILALHDLDRDSGISDPEAFAERSRNNVENRCLHQHVFDLDLLQALFAHLGWDVLELEEVKPAHSVVVARKP